MASSDSCWAAPAEPVDLEAKAVSVVLEVPADLAVLAGREVGAAKLEPLAGAKVELAAASEAVKAVQVEAEASAEAKAEPAEALAEARAVPAADSVVLVGPVALAVPKADLASVAAWAWAHSNAKNSRRRSRKS